MAQFVSEIQSLIGPAPAGFEWLEYLALVLILLFLLDAICTFVSGIFKWIGGR